MSGENSGHKHDNGERVFLIYQAMAQGDMQSQILDNDLYHKRAFHEMFRLFLKGGNLHCVGE